MGAEQASVQVVRFADRHTTAVMGLLLVQVFFGALSVAGKLAFRGFEPLALAALRVAIAGAVLFSLQRAFVGESVERRHLAQLALFSLFGIVGNQLLFIVGLERTDPVAATVLVTTIPVFTLLVAVLFKVERAGWRKITGILLAFGGVIVMVGVSRAAFGSANALGNLLVTLNALSYAIYLVLARNLVRRYQPLTVAAWTFLFGALIIVPVGLPSLLRTDWQVVPPEAWGALVYVVLFATVATYFLNNWALSKVASSTVAFFVFLQPVVTAVLAYAVLDVLPTPSTMIGAAFIFAGLWFAAISRKTGLVPFGRMRA